MRYARNMSKAALARRIVLSWIVVAVIFLIIGFCLGAAVTKHGCGYCTGATEDGRKEAEHETG